MGIVDLNYLKSKFEDGDIPNGQDYIDMIDTLKNPDPGPISYSQSYIFNFSKQNIVTVSLLKNSESIFVYFDGVYQQSNSYTVDILNKTIDFGNLDRFTISNIQVKCLMSNVSVEEPYISNFNKQSIVTLPYIDSQSNINVYFDGVYQDSSSYTVNITNKTIDFGDLDDLTIDTIEVRHF